jgi:non-specific serine/threonine protein kinase/serine/threonine-protein kinase
VLSAENRYAEAEALLRQILIERQRVLGADHTDTLLSQYNLASVLRHEGRNGEAESQIRQTLEAQARVLDPNDPDTLASRSLLADILLAEKRPKEAEEFARQAFNDQLRTLGVQHRDTLESLGALGTALAQTGRFDEAKQLYLDTIEKIGADKSQEAREDVFGLWYDLADLAAQAGRRDEAFEYLDRAVNAGYANAQFMRTDEMLMPLRKDPRFDKLVARARAANLTRAPQSK